MGGRTIRTKAEQIGNIQLQTSTYGLALPIRYGTNAGTGNLIWYGNFKAIPHTEKTKAGKGLGKVTQENTTYTYTAAVMMAIGEGPVISIGKVWKGKEETTMAALGLSLIAGNPGQAPWAFLTGYNVPSNWSKEVAYGYPTSPAFTDQALGYDTTALVVASAYDLGDSAAVPNHRFEIFGNWRYSGPILDCNPRDVIIDFLSSPQYGVGFTSSMLDAPYTNYSNYCVANGLFISPQVVDRRAASEYLEEWLKITNTHPLWSEGKLKLLPKGDQAITGNSVTYTPDLTPVYDLADNDFLPDDDLGPVRIIRSSPADAYNRVSVEFSNRANGYNTEVVSAEDQDAIERFGLRPANVERLDCITESTVAKLAIQIILQDQLYQRNEYEFGLTDAFELLEPGDYVTLSDPDLEMDRVLVRLTEITEAEDGLSCRAEDVLVGVAAAALYQHDNGLRYLQDLQSSPGNCAAPHIFELPSDPTTTGLALGIATGRSAGDVLYGGCNIWVSYDGTDYAQLGSINGSSRYGTLNASISAGDTSLSITLTSGGQLPTASAGEAAEGLTLMTVDQEYLAYASATLTGTDTYTLGGLVRGLHGTTAASHGLGAKITRVDDAIEVIPNMDLSLIGATLYIKLTAFNTYEGGEQQLSTVSAYTYTINGYMEALGKKAQLAKIGEDEWLHPSEKLQVIREHGDLSNSVTDIIAKAAAVGVNAGAFSTAMTALTTYLGTLNPGWSDTNSSTPVVRATWNSKWSDVYNTRQLVLNAIDLSAATASSTIAHSTKSLFSNFMFDQWVPGTSPIRPAGVRGALTGNTMNDATLGYVGGVLGSDLAIGVSYTSEVNALFPMFRVNHKATYRVRGRIKVSSTGASSGLYVRFRELDTEPSTGKLFLTASTYTGTDPEIVPSTRDRTGGTTSLTGGSSIENSGALTTSYQDFNIQLTPTVTAKYAGLTISRWTGLGSREVHLENLIIEELLPTTLAAWDADAAADIAELDRIGEDGWLTAVEKQDAINRWNEITGELTGIQSAASDLNITTDLTAYTASYNSLSSYLGGLSPGWNITTSDTVINRTTWKNTWKAYYDARQTLLNRIDFVGTNSSANLKLTKAGASPNNLVQTGNSIKRLAGNWADGTYFYTQPFFGNCIMEMDVSPVVGWNFLVLHNSTVFPAGGWSTARFSVFYNQSNGFLQAYNNGVFWINQNIGTGMSRIGIYCTGSVFRAYADGAQVGTDAPMAVPGETLYGQFVVVDTGQSHANLIAAPLYDDRWSSLANRPLFRLFQSNMLDMSGWKFGGATTVTTDQFYDTTSQSSYQQITGPEGVLETVMRASANGVNAFNGGWSEALFDREDGFDNTKSHIYMCMVRRTPAHTGYAYFGPLTTADGVNSVLTLAGVEDTNPYFLPGYYSDGVTLSEVDGKWWLWVGVVHGSGYTGADQGISGIYNIETGVRVIDGVEYKYRTTATKGAHRIFQYGNQPFTTQMWFTRPLVAELGTVTIQQIIAAIKTATQETGADVTAIVDGAASIEVACDYLGAPKTGVLPIESLFKHIRNGVAVTSGNSWRYRINEGGINGKTNASGWTTISGTGSILFPVTSVEQDHTQAYIECTYGIYVRSKTLDVHKVKDSPPPGGGTSGNPSTDTVLSSFSATTHAVVSDDFYATPTGTVVNLTCDVTITISGASTAGVGGETYLLFQWWNGSAWADVGTEVASNPDLFREETLEPTRWINSIPGRITVTGTTRQKTGLTAGTEYKFRALMRRSTGASANTYNASGNVTAAAG